MRRFHLQRDVDVTGVSGTGAVAEGVQFTDGSCALRWRSEHTSTAVYASIGDVETIHGHNGATRVVWVDEASLDNGGWRNPDGTFNAGCAIHDGTHPVGSCAAAGAVEDDCPHCSPTHGSPRRCAWGVRVDSEVDGDGQPTRLIVQPTDGAHVAPADARWLWSLIRRTP